MSYLLYDINGDDCHNFGVQDGCKSHCPVFQRGECNLYEDGKNALEVHEMIDGFVADGQICEDEAAEHKESYPIISKIDD